MVWQYSPFINAAFRGNKSAKDPGQFFYFCFIISINFVRDSHILTSNLSIMVFFVRIDAVSFYSFNYFKIKYDQAILIGTVNLLLNRYFIVILLLM